MASNSRPLYCAFLSPSPSNKKKRKSDEVLRQKKRASRCRVHKRIHSFFFLLPLEKKDRISVIGFFEGQIAVTIPFVLLDALFLDTQKGPATIHGVLALAVLVKGRFTSGQEQRLPLFAHHAIVGSIATHARHPPPHARVGKCWADNRGNYTDRARARCSVTFFATDADLCLTDPAMCLCPSLTEPIRRTRAESAVKKYGSQMRKKERERWGPPLAQT